MRQRPSGPSDGNMKSNQTILLGIVAALGVVAAVLWGSKPPASPAKSAEPGAAAVAQVPPPAAATEAQAPVAPPSPLAGATSPEHQAVGLSAPATNGELPPHAHARKLDGPVSTPEQLAWALGKAVEAGGGEAALRSLHSARWKLMLSSLNRTMFLEMKTDAKGSLVARDEQTGVERFLVDTTCRTRRGRIVVECNWADELLVRALMVGERAALPTRLLGTATVETDAPDFIYLAVPTGWPDERFSFMMNRDDAVVFVASWGEAVLYADGRATLADRVLPLSWALEPGTSAAPKRERGKLPPARSTKEMLARRYQAQTNIRVTGVEPLREKVTIKLPELTASEPLKVVALPAAQYLMRPAGKHAAVGEIGGALAAGTAFDDTLDLVLGEAFAPAQKAPNLDQGTAFWLTLPATPGIQLRFKDKLTEMPALSAVAQKLVRAPWVDLPDQLAKFVAEVKAAGHEPADAATFARYWAVRETDPVLFELNVPLKAQ